MKYRDTVRETSKVYRGLFRKIKGYYGAFWLSQCLAITMDIAYALVIAKAFQNIIDQITSTGTMDIQAILFYVLAVLLVVLVWGFGDNYINARLSDRLQCHYRHMMFDSLIHADVFNKTQIDPGDMVKRYSVDVKNAVQFLIRRISSSILSPLIGGIGCVILLIQIHPLLALLAVGVGFLVFALQKIPVPQAEEYAAAQIQAESDYSADMYDIINNLPVIRIFCAMAFLRSRIRKDTGDVYSAGKNALKIELYQKFMMIVGQFLQTLVLIIAGAFFIEQGSISIGELFAAITYAETVSFMFDGISRGLASVQGGKKAGLRILEVLHLSPAKNIVSSIQSAKNAIEVNQLSFFTEEKQVLRNVSFSIGEGEKVALVGKSGSGKTTLARILSGLLSPSQGEVRMKSGNICYVPAVSHLLQGTVQDNITCFVAHQDVHQVKKLMRTLGLEEETREILITNHGENVSGGQRQRIMIARALYNENDIYIFDEPTAALDQRSADMVMDTILEMLGNKTVLMITHDETIAARLDRKLTLRDGKLISAE